LLSGRIIIAYKWIGLVCKIIIFSHQTIVGMASSRRTLDIDNLTYGELYLKSQTEAQISSYTIPVIPAGSNVYKIFQYFTPEQVLSTANLTFTPSTIPDISNAIVRLSVNQHNLNTGLSTISTLIGNNISTTQSTTTGFYTYQQSTLYYSSFTQLITSYNNLQTQNTQTLSLQRTILTLGNSISSISSKFDPTFSTFSGTFDTIFNQGPSVSAISTYVTTYFTNISSSINQYSTNNSIAISTNIGIDFSTLYGYSTQIQAILTSASGPGVSTLSTILISTLIDYNRYIAIYNPSYGVSTLSTSLQNSLSSLSSYYILNAGIPGICSLSTSVNRRYLSSILQGQRTAGTPGLCTMSTYLQSITQYVSTDLAFNQGPTVSTFSTLLTRQINILNNSISTVGYTYLILQQEAVSISLSTLSTSFNRNYNNLATLSSFSSLIPSVYSSLSTVFNLESPYATLDTLSTLGGSNNSTLSNYISSVYKQIYSGPGLSSFSTYINPNFSSLSTSLSDVFSSFKNYIYNISSIRTDPGVSSLSTYIQLNTAVLFSSYNGINQSINTISQQSFSTINLYYHLSTNDAATYSNLNPTNSINGLNSNIASFSNFINNLVGEYVVQTSNVSTFAKSMSDNYISSLLGVENLFFNNLTNIVSSYTAVSTIVESNIYSPTFSTFSTNTIFASNLRVNSALYISSLGIRTSTTSFYNFSMKGNAEILPLSDPTIHHILVGNSYSGKSVFINSNAPSTYNFINSDPGFDTVNDIAYNGTQWVIVGVKNNIAAISYTTNPSSTWTPVTQTLLSNLTRANTVGWSGSNWLAGTSGQHALIKSTDGINWSDATPLNTMEFVSGLGWNGFSWVAVGGNGFPPYNTIIYTDSMDIWQQSSNTFTTAGNDIATNGRTWVAVGSGDSQIKYSYDAINWINVSNAQLSTANVVTWNGDIFLAGGSNGNTSNLMQSYDGSRWNYIPFSNASTVNAITWDGTLWNIAGSDDGSVERVVTSPNLLSWSTLNIGVTTGKIKQIGYASNTTPTIQLSNFDIFSKDIPAMMNTKNRLNIIQSTIYFNDGGLTIRKQPYPYENYANIGINTTYPEYALDIAVGNARKPVGTNWVTASDARVKTEIESVNLLSCAKIISEIPIHTYKFTERFQEKTGTSGDPQYGFIAQDIKKVLPQCVSYTKEHGFDDFHSLDTDQIFKIEFGATQYLLAAVASLENQISTLEYRVN